MTTNYILTLTSTDKKSISNKICKKLLEEKLCACINIIPNIKSHFYWGNEINRSNEILLIIKSKKSSYKKIEETIKKLHNYVLPEIISINIENGFKAYLKWIENAKN